MTEADVIQPSASIASTGLALRYIGEHCYAYSGLFPATIASQTLLSFTSGAGYIKAIIQGNAPVDDDTVSLGTVGGFMIIFNEQKISLLKADGTEEDMPTSVSQSFIIPPFTKVEVTMTANLNEADRYGSVGITGRVYGAT